MRLRENKRMTLITTEMSIVFAIGMIAVIIIKTLVDRKYSGDTKRSKGESYDLLSEATEIEGKEDKRRETKQRSKK